MAAHNAWGACGIIDSILDCLSVCLSVCLCRVDGASVLVRFVAQRVGMHVGVGK